MAALERGWGEWAMAGGGPGLAGPPPGGRGRPGSGPAFWTAPRGLGPHSPGGGGGGGGGGPGPSLPIRSGPRRRRKHKLDQEPEDCPDSKKRLTDPGLCPSTSAAERWMLGAGPPAGGGPASPALALLPRPEAPCEEMEPVGGEPQCEAARRRLREIEDRITDEDEDEDGLAEGPLGNLPTLILSDTLKTGLRRDYAGDLTKKIIESMSQPSMELVVWKPLPEFLTKKAKSVSVKNYQPTAERCPAKPATLEAAFSLQTGKFSEPQQAEMPSDFYSAVEPAGCSEEEMEL